MAATSHHPPPPPWPGSISPAERSGLSAVFRGSNVAPDKTASGLGDGGSKQQYHGLLSQVLLDKVCTFWALPWKEGPPSRLLPAMSHPISQQLNAFLPRRKE